MSLRVLSAWQGAPGNRVANFTAMPCANNVARHAPNEVTEAMNRVCDELELPGPFVLEAGRRILQRNEW